MGMDSFPYLVHCSVSCELKFQSGVMYFILRETASVCTDCGVLSVLALGAPMVQQIALSCIA